MFEKMHVCFIVNILTIFCCLGTDSSIQYPPELQKSKVNINSSTPVETTTILLPPLKFPDENATNQNIPFIHNRTLEQKFLDKEFGNIPPSIFPKENATKTNNIPFNHNRTIEEQLLNRTIISSKGKTTMESKISPPLVSTATPTNNTDQLPLKIFPNDKNKYVIKVNSTQEEIYLNKSHINESKQNNKIDTEVPDLLSNKQYNGEDDVDQVNNDSNPKLVDKSQKLSSLSINNSQNYVNDHLSHDHLTNGKSQPIPPGHIGGILIGILVVIGIFAYASLVLWRRSLEYKYGNRERLVNEEDFDISFGNRFEL